MLIFFTINHDKLLHLNWQPKNLQIVSVLPQYIYFKHKELQLNLLDVFSNLLIQRHQHLNDSFQFFVFIFNVFRQNNDKIKSN